MKKLKFRARDAALFVGIMALCALVCVLLSQVSDDNNPFAVPVFILAVALVSRYTAGYCWGIAAAAVGVVCVNYMFTYPFWEFDLSVTGYPLTFAAMLVVSVIISALTTRIKNQERLRYEAESEKMRANLLRSVSHDIRTPLASMLGASSTLMENRSLPEGDRDGLLREINRDALWLTRITENILSVTRFSESGVSLRKVDEVVEEICGSAIAKFRNDHGDIRISVKKPDEILLVPMDGMLMKQVLVNLFENVAAHGETATRIRLEIRDEADRVTFSVADDGVGFPPGSLPRVFDGYYALSTRERSDDSRNLGIGLSVCNSILRAHGGGMSAENNECGGATVRFWLPKEDGGEA